MILCSAHPDYRGSPRRPGYECAACAAIVEYCRRRDRAYYKRNRKRIRAYGARYYAECQADGAVRAEILERRRARYARRLQEGGRKRTRSSKYYEVYR